MCFICFKLYRKCFMKKLCRGLIFRNEFAIIITVYMSKGQLFNQHGKDREECAERWGKNGLLHLQLLRGKRGWGRKLLSDELSGWRQWST